MSAVAARTELAVRVIPWLDVANGEEGAVLALDGSGPPADEIDDELRDVDPRG